MDFLLRSRCGLRKFAPWVRIREGRVEEGTAPVLQTIGGRGNLVIYQDTAAVLERRGQLTRVVGIGYTELDRFEKVYDTIDLRPRRCLHTVKAMTREGIPISWQVEIQYQIAPGDAVATEAAPYPLSHRHVLHAATCKWAHKVGGSGILDWEGRLVHAEVDRHLREILSRYSLNQLIKPPAPDKGDDAATVQMAIEEGWQAALDAERGEEDYEPLEGLQATRDAIRDQLERELRQGARKTSARILNLRLDNLTVDDLVTQQWIKAWKAKWENWSTGQLAGAEAEYMHLSELAKAEAQGKMVQRIAAYLEEELKGQRLRPDELSQLLLRLSSVLDRSDFAHSVRVFFPTETIKALDDIQEALRPG